MSDLTNNIQNSTQNKILAYISRVEQEAQGFFQELEKSEDQQELIDGFIDKVSPEDKKAFDNPDEEIKKLWKNLRTKILEQNQEKSAETTKRYVKEFIKDITPKPKTRKTTRREISSKIKLTKEEENQLKLFGKL